MRKIFDIELWPPQGHAHLCTHTHPPHTKIVRIHLYKLYSVTELSSDWLQGFTDKAFPTQILPKCGAMFW